MLKLKLTKTEYDALSDDLKTVYKAEGDEFVVQVDGMKTQADVDNVKEALRKEKEDRKAADAKVKEHATEIATLGDKITVYESDDSKKMGAEERVEFERLKRENETLTTEKGELETKFSGLEGEVATGKIRAAITKAGSGILSEAALKDADLIDTLSSKFVISENKVLTNTELGDKSGLEAEAYLSDYVKDRTHLAPTSSGGGAGGGGGSGGGSQNVPDTGEITVSSDLWDGK